MLWTLLNIDWSNLDARALNSRTADFFRLKSKISNHAREDMSLQLFAKFAPYLKDPYPTAFHLPGKCLRRNQYYTILFKSAVIFPANLSKKLSIRLAPTPTVWESEKHWQETCAATCAAKNWINPDAPLEKRHSNLLHHCRRKLNPKKADTCPQMPSFWV